MEAVRNLGRDLKWNGAIILLVGSKLLLSFFFPGLRTPGELLLSGGLLLFYGVRTLQLGKGLQDRT
jgi:hypothetical protein